LENKRKVLETIATGKDLLAERRSPGDKNGDLKDKNLPLYAQSISRCNLNKFSAHRNGWKIKI